MRVYTGGAGVPYVRRTRAVPVADQLGKAGSRVVARVPKLDGIWGLGLLGRALVTTRPLLDHRTPSLLHALGIADRHSERHPIPRPVPMSPPSCSNLRPIFSASSSSNASSTSSSCSQEREKEEKTSGRVLAGHFAICKSFVGQNIRRLLFGGRWQVLLRCMITY